MIERYAEDRQSVLHPVVHSDWDGTGGGANGMGLAGHVKYK